MGDLTVKGLLFPMEDSLCKDCKFRMSRVLLPLDLEEFGLTEEELENIGVNEDDKVVVENHCCMALQEEMSYVVYECNQYKCNKPNKLFFNDIT